MSKKMPLAERIEKLTDALRRERELHAGSTLPAEQGYWNALTDVIAELRHDMTRNEVQALLRTLSEDIELAGMDCHYDIDAPSDFERKNRAYHMQLKRLFYQIDNLLKDLPKDKEFGDR